MLRRILFPTDGSALSEQALPLAQRLAQAQGAEITAVRVVELPRWIGDEPQDYLSGDVYQDLLDAMESDAHQSLRELARGLGEGGIPVTTLLRHGSPAGELLDCEEEVKPDLVVMATHGRTGLARFALGSVADRLVRQGSAPVLLVRSFETAATEMHQALVPLDGSPLAEEALPVVESLAGKPLRQVRLLRAIRPTDDREPAMSYLQGVASRLAAAGLDATTEVRGQPPAEAIEAAAQSIDIVIMATHGRSGFDRLRHGSIAEQVSHHLAIPVLLVRAGIGIRNA